MVRFRRVGLELKVGEDCAQEQPGAKFARHQIGVLALPAEPGARRQRLFEQRRGVDEDLDVRLFRPRRSDQEGGKFLELALEDIVIVAMAGVNGNDACVAPLERLLADRSRVRN